MLEYVLLALGALIGLALVIRTVVRWQTATGSITAPTTASAAAGTPNSTKKKSGRNWLNPLPWLGKWVSWKLVLLLFVAFEGGFASLALSNIPRPAILDWIPHWGMPTLAAASSWIWSNWLAVIVIYGANMAFLAIASKGTTWEKDADKLKAVLTIGVLAAFLLLPPLSWLVGYPSSSHRMTETLYPKTEWINLTLDPGESSPRIWVRPGGYTVPINGPVATRITCLYVDRPSYTFRADQTPCPAGNMSYVAVTNPYTTPITVKYKLLRLAGP